MPKTLLLADDSVTIQKVVGISFANEDVKLLTVDNGDDAVAKARETRPDLVLADAVMPGKNGYEVCEAIKHDPSLRHIPVLLLTGTFETFDEERAQAVGIDGHISKPFEAQALVEQVNALLQRAPVAPAAAPTAAASAPPTGVVSAAPTAPPGAPAAAPAGASAAEGESVPAYDFFDDDLSELATSGGAGPQGGQAAADRTVAILPDPPPSTSTEAMLGDSDYDIFEGAEEPNEPPLAEEDLASLDFAGDSLVGMRDPLASTQDDPAATEFADNAFEFGVEDSASPRDVPDAVAAEFGASDLGQQTVIDPRGASGYDVSVSDLGSDPLATGGGGMGDSASAVTEPRIAAPPPPAPQPQAPQPAAPAASRGPAAPAPQPAASGGSPELSAEVQKRLHDTLEKVAWEAFSDLSETVVKQALKRVETIAWEVIPQMAESLIREEIRRIKGEPDES